MWFFGSILIFQALFFWRWNSDTQNLSRNKNNYNCWEFPSQPISISPRATGAQHRSRGVGEACLCHGDGLGSRDEVGLEGYTRTLKLTVTSSPNAWNMICVGPKLFSGATTRLVSRSGKTDPLCTKLHKSPSVRSVARTQKLGSSLWVLGKLFHMTPGCDHFLQETQQVHGIQQFLFQVPGMRQDATAAQCLKDWKALHVWFENRKMAVLFT